MAKSRKPQVLQNEVLARTLARQSKSRIAREMSIDRQTVTRIQECHNLPRLLADSHQFIVENVVPDAIHSLHAQIIDRDAPGDGDLAARVLEKSGVLDGGSAPTFNIYEDKSLQMAVALVPPMPPNAIPHSTASASEVAAPPDAGAALTVEAVPPAPAEPKRAAHQPDCGCEDCRCPDCHLRRNPRDAAGRILLSDRCLCVPRGAIARPGLSLGLSDS